TGMHRSDWLLAHGWVIGAAVLATAGLYQFSALKYRCLDTSAGRRSALSSSTGAARTSVGRHFCSAAGLARFASLAALWLWGRTPYSRYLDHGNWTEIGVAGALCRALPGGSEVVTGLLVVAGWLLMRSWPGLTRPSTSIRRRLARFRG